MASPGTMQGALLETRTLYRVILHSRSLANKGHKHPTKQTGLHYGSLAWPQCSLPITPLVL